MDQDDRHLSVGRPINSEQRRVLYVGVSRAMKELVIVVPASRRDALESILVSAGIQHTVTVG
jgi:ATP-dependent DNA helicase UvrD/PcrA